MKRVMLLLACFSLAGCRHYRAETADLGQRSKTDAHYAHLFGQRYRTRVDLYLFAFTADPEYWYLGIATTAFGPRELPAGVTRDNIGKAFERKSKDGLGDLKIVDVVPAGSELTIESETHEVTALSGVRGAGGYPMGFICEVRYEGKDANGVLTEFIQSQKKVTAKVPNQEINEAIASKMEP